MPDTTFVALGANLPLEGVPARAVLSLAVSALRSAGLTPRALSGIWETAAWPPESGQPDYYNAVVELDRAGLAPQQLYEALAAIERRFGRERRERNSARTLDLDIVAMDGLVGTFEGLELPHPRMHERAFVLAPLAEIAADWRHPIMGRTASELLADLPVSRYRRVSDLAG
ncbi:MAG: 2-amino-4-hydroxy-6-hydroxymethyldihydropteridine diphosphokinase [Alphaproteobacteria bacterium]|nr:MAG: 2-amino-4-hydroxy-6-hydroxymethyldihydropteridine diphosphokinase [Alphaproteobacteria bacterium]